MWCYCNWSPQPNPASKQLQFLIQVGMPVIAVHVAMVSENVLHFYHEATFYFYKEIYSHTIAFFLHTAKTCLHWWLVWSYCLLCQFNQVNEGVFMDV